MILEEFKKAWKKGQKVGDEINCQIQCYPGFQSLSPSEKKVIGHNIGKDKYGVFLSEKSASVHREILL